MAKKFKSIALIEVMLAVGALVVISVALISFSQPAFMQNRENLSKLQARLYVQEAMEQIRNIRDNNLKNNILFFQNITNTGSKIKIDVNQDESYELVNSSNDFEYLGNGYWRRIYVKKDGDDALSVEVTVKCGESLDNSSAFTSSTYLTDWKR